MYRKKHFKGHQLLASVISLHIELLNALRKQLKMNLYSHKQYSRTHARVLRAYTIAHGDDEIAFNVATT